MPSAHLSTSRRAALGGLVSGSLVLATGCDAMPGPRPPAGPDSPGATPDEELDARLLDDAVRVIEKTLALVVAATDRHRGLAPEMEAVAGMHEAHLDVLVESSTTERRDVPRSRIPRTPSAALALVLRREQVTGRSLAQLAAQAESGPFARLLASMSAAGAQHVAALSPSSTASLTTGEL